MISQSAPLFTSSVNTFSPLSSAFAFALTVTVSALRFIILTPAMDITVRFFILQPAPSITIDLLTVA